MNSAALNSAELTALHTETVSEAAHARTLANIARRASRLWEVGYTATETMSGLYVRCFQVTSPEGMSYRVKVSKTPAAPSTFFGSRCSCPCFEKELTCKHLQAVEVMIGQEDAQIAAYEARQDNDDDPYAEL